MEGPPPSTAASLPSPSPQADEADEDSDAEEEAEPDDQDGVAGSYHLPSTRCHKFIARGYAALARDLLDDRETPPATLNCTVCHDSITTKPPELRDLFSCDDCLCPARQCHDCLLASHRALPFHRIHRWDSIKRFWHRVHLGTFRFEFCLEHDGTRCPAAPSEARDFVVVHDQGIDSLPIVPCACLRALPLTTQLMRAGLWPATWENPRSAITITALKIFQSLSTTAHTTAHDFVHHLQRMTDVVAPENVQDRIREFRIAIRTYSYVHACRRAGLDPSAQLPVGSLAVLCPACPQPEHNMRPGWENRQGEYAYVDALHFCVDGNFHFNLKPKHTDPKDVPLTLGAGYFGHEVDFKHYIATTKPYPNEPSTCSQFVAMGAGKYKGPVSGIVALVCRHNLVLQGGIVDLTKGEKFLYVDFANVSALQRYTSLRMLVMMYDINCQYIKNFMRRIQDQFAPAKRQAYASIQSADIPQTIVAGIGKYHAPMHTAECRPFHSLNNLPGAADSFGENAEQKWADIEGITRATKEMSAGHRHDKINDHNSYTNTRLVHGMVDHLLEKYETAQALLADAQAYVDSVEESIDDQALIASWQKEHDQWEADVIDVKNHARMKNPFEVPTEASLTTHMIIAQLNEDHERQGNRHGIALVDAIEAAFRLENVRLDLLRKIEVAEPNPQECKKISTKVDNYRRDLRICHDEFEVLMAPAVAKAIQDAEATTRTLPHTFPRHTPDDDLALGIESFKDKPPSYEVVPDTLKRKSLSRSQKTLRAFAQELAESGILLPSSYHLLVRNHVGMQSAAESERRLREGLATEALDKLRLHITTHKALELRRRQVSGVINNTDVDRRLTEKRLATDRAKYEYRKHRYLLRVLGMPDNHPKFKRLLDSDCYAFAITAAEHRLGDSHRLPSWIWGDFSYVVKVKEGDIRQFLDDSLKAHWFRHSAFVRRWREAVNIRREEMYRTVQSYLANRDLWVARADAWETGARGGAAAFARRQAYRYERLASKAKTKFPSDYHVGIGMAAAVA